MAEVAALNVNNIEVMFHGNILVLKGVSLEVPPGKITAVLGANGAGKTTTLKAISGLLKAEDGAVTDGSIEFMGERIHRKAAEEIVGMGIFQVMEGRRVFEHLSVEQNLIVSAYRRKDGDVKERLDLVYRYFPRLKDMRNIKAGYVSGGEQQMTVVGRALMAGAKLVLLDEASMGLAPLLIKEIYDIIIRLNEEEKVTFLIVEQNAKLALNIASYAYVMETGRVVMDGPSDKLAENPDIKEFYLGLSDVGRKDFRAAKHYKRRKRWLT